MTIEFVALIVIMVLLIVIAFLLLKSLSTSADVRIRSDMQLLLKSYDQIIDEKTQEIHGLQVEKQELQNRMAGVKSRLNSFGGTSEGGGSNATGDVTKEAVGVPILQVAQYRPEDLKAGYKAIRDSFGLSKSERKALIEAAVQDAMSRHEGRGAAAKRLYDELDFDAVYEIGMLNDTEQLEVLEERLEGEEKALLTDFLQDYGDYHFDITDFRDWLRDLETLEGNKVSVRCGDEEISEEEGLEFDDNIFEGIQVRVGNRLYDYSIKEREIG